MNAATQSIEQKAKITAINGNVQLIRDGFFLPAQIGVELLPGDRVISDTSGKAVIQFTGVNNALVIEKGAAATFNLEVVELDKAPQWIASDLFGEGIYFDSKAPVKTAAADAASSDLFSLFGTESTEASSGSTGYPVLESLVFLGATAAIYNDNEDNPDNSETMASESGSSGDNANPGTGTPQPSNPEPPAPETTQGPLDSLLGPVPGVLDGLLGVSGTASPLSTLQANQAPSNPVSNLLGAISTS